MYELAKELFPICRSITGNGVRQTLAIIRRYLPNMTIYEVPTGTRVLDWDIPPEWNIRDAYITTPEGKHIADFQRNNLHIVGYSEPIDREISLAELQQHLYSLPDDETDVIPYVTSYFERRWGFCISQRERDSLKEGTYRVVIDSSLEPGSLTYGELIIPGKSEKEILISTYICHPSMANDQVSGMVVATFLAEWVQSRVNNYTHRFIFIPETIGSITYLSRNLPTLKRNVIAGFNIACVGDDRSYSMIQSRLGNTIADKAARHVLRHHAGTFAEHTFLDRGSDERQYCAPGIDLPVVLVMRTRFGDYPEYHTSLDNLDLISERGLRGGYEANRLCLELLERNRYYKNTILCQPQMARRGLYPTLGTATLAQSYQTRMDVMAYCDGNHSVLDIAERLDRPAWELYRYFDELEDAGLIA